MKKLLVACLISMSVSTSSFADEKLCKVQVCNKLERFTLDIGSLISDHLGEICFDIVLPESEAKPGKEISSESKWYQGSSFNPTKRSVTRIKKVYTCN